MSTVDCKCRSCIRLFTSKIATANQICYTLNSCTSCVCCRWCCSSAFSCCTSASAAWAMSFAPALASCFCSCSSCKHPWHTQQSTKACTASCALCGQQSERAVHNTKERPKMHKRDVYATMRAPEQFAPSKTYTNQLCCSHGCLQKTFKHSIIMTAKQPVE